MVLTFFLNLLTKNLKFTNAYIFFGFIYKKEIAVCRVVSPISRGRWLAGSVIYQECVCTAVTGTFVTLTVPPHQTPPSTPSKSQQVQNTHVYIATEYRVNLFAKVLVKLLFNFFYSCYITLIWRLPRLLTKDVLIFLSNVFVWPLFYVSLVNITLSWIRHYCR